MRSCLIVDDSTTQRKLIRKIVESYGFDTHEVCDGSEGMDFCEVNIPDMIILDMNMPKMSGIEFLKAIEQIPKSYQPYIIVCSAEIDTDAIVAAVKAGANQYHCKSSDVNRLRDKIANSPCLLSE